MPFAAEFGPLIATITRLMRHFVRLAVVLAVCGLAACGGPEPTPQGTGAVSEAAARATADPAPGRSSGPITELPRKSGSLRFAVIGDAGRGDRHQFMTAAKMIEWRQWFEYDFVIMLGDNIYAAGSDEDYAQRFERPYKPLIDAGVPFYAAIGNHDPIGQENYPLFNMGGRRYYAYEKEEGSLKPLFTKKVLFVVIDSTSLTRQQLKWVEGTLADSKAEWKIAYYHHPLYTSGRYQLGASQIRSALEPIFIRQGLDVGFSGHEHFYERITPQHGVQYFVSGAAGALRVGDMRRSGWTAAGFDTDTHFMLVEIAGDTMYFMAISRKGAIVDSGAIRRNGS